MLRDALHVLDPDGGQALDVTLPLQNAHLVEILDTYEVIFAYGPFLAGVREAGAPDLATNLAIQLFNQLKEGAGES